MTQKHASAAAHASDLIGGVASAAASRPRL
jgi:hypothetical protein